MATRDEINEVVKMFQSELDQTAPAIAEALAAPSPRSMSRILALREAGFTNRDIIDAYKAGQLEELYALVEDAA